MQPNKFFPEIKGNFGFGCMRLPMKDGKVDYEEFSLMVDEFIGAGFNYFDTAHGYIDGQSETAIRDCMAKRYDRSRFLLTNKLSSHCFETQADIRPFVKSQLQLCGVEYFDFYLMHAQSKNSYPKYQECKAYETALELKKEGLIRHLGISFHDKADFLDKILTDHPEIEAVQIQFNYVDYEDDSVESRKVYEVCEKHGKPVIIMEPVKGGSLVNLPEEADRIFRELGTGSNASYAVRFAASFKSVAVVLSGMSDTAQMADNLATMTYFEPISDKELAAIKKVCDIFGSIEIIPCTSCRYCVDQNKCPKNIQIPRVLSARNAYTKFRNPNTIDFYNNFVAGNGHGKASDCIKCGMCEKVCPQHLEIRKLLEETAKTFESD